MIKCFSFLILSAFFDSTSCEEQYLDKVVISSTIHSYYLVVNVKIKGSNVQKMFVQRNDFFHVLSFDKTFLRQKNRKEYVKNLLLKKHVFKIKRSSLIKKYFLPLPNMPNKRVDSLCLLGKDRFLETIFDASGLQKNTSFDLGRVVEKLFELRVPVMFYGDAGKLFIDKTFICN